MRYVIYCFLFVSSSCFGQDSLKLISVPKYKLDKLLNSYFFYVPLCDSTVTKSFTANDSLRKSLNLADELIQLRTEERDLKVRESELWQSRFDNIKIIHKEEQKRQFKRGLKVGSGSTLLVAVLLIILL